MGSWKGKSSIPLGTEVGDLDRPEAIPGAFLTGLFDQDIYSKHPCGWMETEGQPGDRRDS